MPTVRPAPRHFALAAVALLGLGMLIELPQLLYDRPFQLRLLTIIFLYATLGHGWNILGGFAGQTSLGHGVFFGLGVYTTTLLLLHFGLTPWLGMIVACVVSAAFGCCDRPPLLPFAGPLFRLRDSCVRRNRLSAFGRLGLHWRPQWAHLADTAAGIDELRIPPRQSSVFLHRARHADRGHPDRLLAARVPTRLHHAIRSPRRGCRAVAVVLATALPADRDRDERGGRRSLRRVLCAVTFCSSILRASCPFHSR